MKKKGNGLRERKPRNRRKQRPQRRLSKYCQPASLQPEKPQIVARSVQVQVKRQPPRTSIRLSPEQYSVLKDINMKHLATEIVVWLEGRNPVWKDMKFANRFARQTTGTFSIYPVYVHGIFSGYSNNSLLDVLGEKRVCILETVGMLECARKIIAWPYEGHPIWREKSLAYEYAADIDGEVFEYRNYRGDTLGFGVKASLAMTPKKLSVNGQKEDMESTLVLARA